MLTLFDLRCLAVAVVLALAAPGVRGEANYSDLWWNAAESGWGAGIQRQGDVIFLTLFVYAGDGSSTWFVVPDMRIAASQGPWQGKLYRTSGPGFASRFEAAARATEAGTATIEFADAQSATLRYTVDGEAVTKSMTRMTWREPSPEGRYHGGFSTFIESCVDPTRVGTYDLLGPVTVTQSGTQVSLALSSGATGVASTCTFTGTAAQSGRLARWTGSFACSIVIGLDGRGEDIARTSRRGTFMLDRVAITADGIRGALTASDQDCAMSGYMGGTRLP